MTITDHPFVTDSVTFTRPAKTEGTLATSFAKADTEARKLVGVAYPIGVPSAPAMDGYSYTFSAPHENVDDLVDVVDEHWDDAVVGRLAQPLDVADARANAVARIFPTTRGNDLLVEAAEEVKTGFSVRALVLEYTEDTEAQTRDVSRWTLAHLGVVRDPAFTEAKGLALAASRQKGTPRMTTTTPADATTTPPTAEFAELPTIEELATRVAEINASALDKGQHPLRKYKSRAHWFSEFRTADKETKERMAVEFALVDQVTTDNPGLMAPGWRQEIKANLDRRRPMIEAEGGSIPLPEAGMDSNWPYFDGDLDALITRQLAEKTELNSVKVSIKKATAPIKTAGMASDISYQLILRGTPSYLAAYQGIGEAAWARYTEAVHEAAVLAAATDIGDLPADLSTAAGAKAFRALLFQGSAAVEDATGSPATIAGVSPNVWLALGGNDALPAENSADGRGTSTASSLTIVIDNLVIRRMPFFPDSQLVMTNGDAVRFAEQGPMVATDEAVAKLGRDVAVWGMYEDAEVYFPAGVVKFNAAA